ncbi:F-box/LRR-repeat protein 2 [Zootermopsis nevadensis]|uniref:F-box/LRR-repeat protein 2 n=1 Tax=Zootermopsis nevadensis TaxID=136037 RepID=A0A067QMT3_ZOONE|nr:F-box/LRR-repeat protein 2 [Zootermopsis nevadensis]
MNCCHRITDSGIIELVKHLSRLKHLELWGCSELTDASLTAIRQRCSKLKFLNINDCTGMSLEGSERLKLCLHSLHGLHRRNLL